MNKKAGYFSILLILLLSFFTAPFMNVNAQTYMETFGQNRLQYRKFDWKFFDTRHFRIYHYDRAGRQLARYVAEEAERDITVIEKKMGGQFPKRFNIILYNNYDEYRQTNIGLKYESQLNENTIAGTLDLVGDKLVVYFTGLHTDLRDQIRQGMAHVVLERMFFGENFRKMVKSSLSENLPPWVAEGYISYLVDGWTPQINDKWRSLLQARPQANFNDLSNEYPELAGAAFWKFVSEQYGESAIKNLLYNMQQKKSVNKAMREPQTLNMKVVKAYDSCLVFYKHTFAIDDATHDHPDSSDGILDIEIPKNNAIIKNIMVAPMGSDVAYVEWRDGEFQVYIQKVGDKQRIPMIDQGRKNYTEKPDPNYPLMAWSNNGYKLAILFKQGTQTRLRIYNSLKAQIQNYIVPPNRFDRVLGIAFMEDDDKMVFSAIKKSQTDLYQFTIKGGRMTSITNDAWDDISPATISGGTRRGILFLSNRPKPNLDVPIHVNELPTGPMNLFFYDTKTKRPELLQCSNITKGHISQPIQYGSENFAFLYDTNGVQNKYVVMFGRDKYNHDSAYAIPVTNYANNIISHQYNLATNKVADVIQEGDRYRVYFHPLEIPGKNAQAKTLTPTLLFEPEIDTGKTAFIQNKRKAARARHGNEKPEVEIGNEFQSGFTDTAVTNPAIIHANDLVAEESPEKKAVDSSVLMDINDSTYLKMRAAPYRLSFKPDFFAVRIDNSVLFNQYQSFSDNGGQYSNPSLSALATISLNDLMENHRFTAGIQLPINFTGSTYFLQYQNFTRRIDWGLLYLRTENYYNYLVTYVDPSNNAQLQKEQLGKTVTNMVQFDASYPLDRVRSVRFHTALREDNLILKAQDTLSLLYDLPNAKQFWSTSRIEYVFDNTSSPTLNILNGFRYKFYAEYLYELNNGNRNCYNFGTDFRYYQKIYKNFIWASRISYAHSDGNSEVVYYLGGVDNWISPQYDNANQPSGNYGFQTLATSLRGYDQNARNGNNYAVLNTELRLPILTTFLKKPVQSAILKNLQFVAFLDAGSAWRGFAPTAASNQVTYTFGTYAGNSINPGINPSPVLQLSQPDQSGLAIGFGPGLRTSLLGYFLRCDVAWSIDGTTKPIIYFALGTDF